MNWSETPKHQSKLAAHLAAVLFALGLGMYLLSPLTPYPAIFQTVAIAALCAAIFFVARHQEKFTYRLEPDIRGGEGTDFVVVQKKSRQEITVCRLGVEDVREIDRQTPDNAAELKQKFASAHTQVHSYCVDMLPQNSVYLTFDDGGNSVVIRLQCSDELLSVFERELKKKES